MKTKGSQKRMNLQEILTRETEIHREEDFINDKPGIGNDSFGISIKLNEIMGKKNIIF